MSRQRHVRVYQSFEEEDRDESRRRRALTPADRDREFSHVQRRAFGPGWTSTPMRTTAWWEKVGWMAQAIRRAQ